MPALLVRHASAGDRDQWGGDDRLRPLDEQGRKQAADLVPLLRAHRVTRLLSSPAVRCRQTVKPFAEAHGVVIEERDELAEGAGRSAALGLLEALGAAVAALCTHGDVIEGLLGREIEKGSACLVEPGPSGVRELGYVPPAA
ncbi:MAG: histidine phosphatase family protein [Actinomycetota bacterium]|nr:histidine phosphatase family protein [Actinomycetota bacterium]